MPIPKPTSPPNPLETASLCQYLNAQYNTTLRWMGTVILRDGRPVDDLGPIYLSGWRAQYPTPASMREQLRALIRPVLQRSAA